MLRRCSLSQFSRLRGDLRRARLGYPLCYLLRRCRRLQGASLMIRPWEEMVTASEAIATILLKENNILRIYVQMKLGG